MDSGRDRYSRINWEEAAGVIRFNFMCPHTVNGAVARAMLAGTSWFATRPLCQFKTTANSLLPGLRKRTSKNVSPVRLEPETVTE
jgi:hypothetical protein